MRACATPDSGAVRLNGRSGIEESGVARTRFTRSLCPGVELRETTRDRAQLTTATREGRTMTEPNDNPPPPDPNTSAPPPPPFTPPPAGAAPSPADTPAQSAPAQAPLGYQTPTGSGPQPYAGPTPTP